MVPVSRKRSTPNSSDDDDMDEPHRKRQRISPVLPQTPPPELELPHTDKMESSLFDSDVRTLLRKTICQTLAHVGYDRATEEALEAMCMQVDTYTTHLLSQVTNSMLNARRNVPIPHDIAYAFNRYQLPLASLEPHLRPPISVPKLKVEVEPAPEEDKTTKNIIRILGKELNGEVEKAQKSYIPKGFPAFPSKHTFKWTPKESERVTDPRKIREEAAKNARMGEEALRRLVKVGKVGKDRDMKRMAGRDPKSKERHELWERAMLSLAGEKGNTHTASGNGNGKEKMRDLALDERSMVVNAEKQYFRTGAPAKRKIQPQPPPPPSPMDEDLVQLEP
ncbi:hypothetical protein SS1G_00901 [Sclerotinia sclerotiorum 1980 UF-70]|uniref:Transcription initiation factor TFIID subunit 8 n=2 Tax=Sclerotinia sclerotiorum (strain ATCC 18683 / 1980 / Ss-1) TaxID=665079 RepID=A7E6H6_SCLS1|nr:hypothetical protein SS1G_00901 [Sclerotinia sclerotiorum 1980 UF-70]APA07586.1 hypothetical protein sscle_03g023560 [Sclerotinia sclerotiorum 1980 UF-70]EDN91498.1 hypothetical protein SS1G_00901 [Sclerotinia sclerotiorum 1980 UF-70]